MTVECIRCDREMEESGNLVEREYMAITFMQERGALPLCKGCFQDVEGRDLWSR